ncbi:TBC1 domain family member whacked [Lycorma delicatula]|uniref:TBC1 domain family member whacked n=1 Tax=Lycorma delicatula TaxID=130591 RepID=UPI003F50E54F
MAIGMSAVEDEDDMRFETCSEASSLPYNGSVVSTVPDRHGFIGGAQYSPDPKRPITSEVILRREKKWLDMISNWEKYMSKNYEKVRERCRKGIPLSIRPRAWLYLCGGKLLMDQATESYNWYLEQEGDAKWIDDIQKDLHRQFPYHEMFAKQGGHGQQDLFNVLKAYSVLNPEVGYCQAQAPLAAFLLMHMPAEEAFWCLVSICDKYLAGYYSQGMRTLLIDGEILFGLLKKVCPTVHKHLKKQKIEPILYMTEWFLCVFTRTLPWPTILRVWDMFLCEGVKIVFKVGLVLLKYSLGDRSMSSLKKNCPTMYETVEALRNPPAKIMEEDFLVKQVLRLKITDDDFTHEHKQQTARHKAKTQSANKHLSDVTDR